MSPEELEKHNVVKTEVGFGIVRLNKRIRRGRFYGDGVLVTHPKAGLSTEPDGTFVLYETLKSRKVRLKRRTRHGDEYTELVGTPDWVLEVVSRTSVRKDTVLLRQAYHSAGIPEYWLITAFGPEIDFQILRWRKRGYAAMPVRDGWRRSPLFDCRFRLTRERDKLGFWEYTLDVLE